MRVFVAGASGAIGRLLVPRLVAAGHEVTGMTRSEESATALRDQGATAVVADIFDEDAVKAGMASATPEIVVHQLTALPKRLDVRRMGRRVRRDQSAAHRGHSHPARGSAAGGCTPDGRPEHRVPLCPPGRCGQGRGREDVHRRARAIRRDGPGADGSREPGHRRGWHRGRGTALRLVLRPRHLLRPRRRQRRRGAQAPAAGHRQGRGGVELHPRGRRGQRDRGSGRGWPGSGSSTWWTTSPRACANGCPPSPTRSARRSRCACPSGSQSWWRRRCWWSMATTLRGASNASFKAAFDWQPRYASWRAGVPRRAGLSPLSVGAHGDHEHGGADEEHRDAHDHERA